MLRGRSASIVEAAVVASCVALVAAVLRPRGILVDALPQGTDLAGHTVIAWLDRTNPALLLPGGWSDEASLGFPVNQLYPWPATALAALLTVAVKLPVAMKLVTVLPLLLLPVAAWGAGRLAGMPRSLSAMLAVGTLPLLFDTTCAVCGGSIGSTLNGEYAYAWGLLLGLLSLGLLHRFLSEGARPVATVLVTAVALLTHPVPAAWLAVAAIALLVLDRSSWWRHRMPTALVGACIGLLALVWWLPFLVRQPWLADMGWPKLTDYALSLLPLGLPASILLIALAVAGAVLARGRWPLVVAVAVAGAVSAAAIVALPEGYGLANVRLYPLYLLSLGLSASAGLQLLTERLLSPVGRRWSRRALTAVPAVATVVAVVLIGGRWGLLGTTTAATFSTPASGPWGNEQTPYADAAESWAWGRVDAEQAAETAQLAALLRRVGEDYGCGRVDMNRGAGGATTWGSVDAIWLAPVWTQGCLASAGVVTLQSSATTAGIVHTESLISDGYQRGVPSGVEGAPDLRVGGARLAQLGVRYYVVHGSAAAERADRETGLTPLLTAGSWKVYGVQGSELVSALDYVPAVVSPTVDDADWDALSAAAAQSPVTAAVPLLQDGPTEWPRVPAGESIPVIPAPEKASVTSVTAQDGSVSFTVAAPGLPVLVKVSDYPGWTVTSGDAEVHRATPNLLVVVPRSTSVTLTMLPTPIDRAALAAGILGLVLLGIAASRGWLRRAATDEAAGPAIVDA